MQTFYAIKLLFLGTDVPFTHYSDFVVYETNASVLSKETVIFLEILINTCQIVTRVRNTRKL